MGKVRFAPGYRQWRRESAQTRKMKHIILYSAEWAKLAALKFLCGYSEYDSKVCIKNTQSVGELVFLLNKKAPDMILLDIPARDYISLLCHIRQRYPDLPVIITQSTVLFSDRTVASWFGNIWLRDYDSLTAVYPDIPVHSVITDNQFAGTDSAAACPAGCPGSVDDMQLLGCMEHWLCQRLSQRVGGERCAQVVTQFLSQGVSPQETGKCLRRSDKLIYHYREKVIRSLGISRHPGDFIPSLTLKNGPSVRQSRAVCRMHIVRTDSCSV